MLPNSTRFRPGATATSWLLKAQQYGTYDFLEALNAGAMGQCVWVEDTEGINGGLPIPCPSLYVEVEEQHTAGLWVYPNPTNDNITVTSANGIEYRISNLLGQTVQSGRFKGEYQQIDVSSLSGGIYFITVGGATTKFMKR